jgi:hypothetical protein
VSRLLYTSLRDIGPLLTISNLHSRRAHVTTDNFKVYPKCNSDRSSCTLAEDPNPWMYSDSLKSAAPLTDCAARSLPPAGNPTWNVYNITYFDMSHNVCLFCIPSPPGGAAFVDLYMSPIDFAMRCSPSGPDLRMSGGGSGSSTWYRCDTGGDLANPPDAPPTWILFDQMTWQVTLRQEWNCTAEDGQVYVLFSPFALLSPCGWSHPSPKVYRGTRSVSGLDASADRHCLLGQTLLLLGPLPCPMCAITIPRRHSQTLSVGPRLVV